MALKTLTDLFTDIEGFTRRTGQGCRTESHFVT